MPTSEPIVLSDAMSYVETELNQVREKALNHARAAKEAEQRKNDWLFIWRMTSKPRLLR